MRDINEIIIHATATRPDWMQGQLTMKKVAEIRRWHVEDNGWNDIAYHFLDDRDGTIAHGRHVSVQGAHAGGHNVGTIGIALMGGHGGERYDKFSDHYTDDQEASLVRLINSLIKEHGPLKITGHNQYANKACPCFNVHEWWAGVNRLATPEALDPIMPEEQPTFWAAFVAAIVAIFGGKK